MSSQTGATTAFDALAGRATTAEQAIANIQAGDRVFIGTACAAPRTLVEALESLSYPPADVRLIHFITTGVDWQREGRRTKFQHRCLFVDSDARSILKSGAADYVPISIAQVPDLVSNGRVPIDVALVQVSAPDEHGYVSLGVSVDITRVAMNHAHTVIAEVNPRMPRTHGNSFVHMNELHHVVLVDTPVTEYQHQPADAVANQIARYVARIIDDGSTLQIGLGRIPHEMLKYLENRRDLGIHSDVITDPIIDLVEKGIVTGRAKTIHKGQIVTSYCLGTERLYAFIDRNPLFSFQPMEYVCDASVLAANHQLVSVTQAFAIGLTGQVCGDQFEGEFYGGVSTQPEFMRGAARSRGGKPIICLPSTTEDGKTSTIRPTLLAGEGVTIARSDVHYVVTEFGSAYLFGKSIRERALALIEIAHPSFRPWLLEEGKKLGYLRSDQRLRSRVAYPVEEERRVAVKGGRQVRIRPARASDVRSLQDVFYALRPEDVYTRFFRRLKSLSVSEAEHLCNVDYENEAAFVAIEGPQEHEHVVGSSCYFVNPTTNLAEVAYMIRPEWQSLGLGQALQQRMIEYAKSKDLRGFTADILRGNQKMVSLARSACDSVDVQSSGETLEVTMLF